MTFRQSLKRFRNRVRNSLPLYSYNRLEDTVKKVVDFNKSRRGFVTQTIIEAVDKIVDQPYPYLILKKYANNHPFLRLVHGAIIREVVRNRWDAKEKFTKKCVTCGQHFEELIDECPDCKDKGFLRDPNPQEKRRLESFLEDPNRDDEMVDIIKSLLKDNLAVDDWYLSVMNGPAGYVIYVEDAAETFICADKHGRIGNGVYFCPGCWLPEKQEKTYVDPGECEFCGGELKESAYVQKPSGTGTVKARFARDEIIHGNSDPWLPKLYGNSKVMAVLLELRTALAMSNYNFGAYSKGVIDKAIFLKGETQVKATEISKDIKEQRERVVIDSWTGRVGRETGGSVFIGAEQGGAAVDLMPDPEKMQSLEWMEFWLVKIVGAIYGVQPVMMNAPTRGPGGYFQRMQIVVQNDTTREYQKMIEDALNEQLLPKLGVHDWEFKFNEVEPRNEMELAQIWQVKVAAGLAAKQAGLNAELTDEGELKISGEFQEPKMPVGATHTLHEIPQAPKPPEPKQNIPFAQDKMKKGKSWLVTEVDPNIVEAEESSD